MSHPPGYENTACLNLPIIAPASITDDLNLCINSFGISVFSIFPESIIILPFFLYALQPNNLKISKVIFISCILGTLYKFVVFPFKILAAIIGSDAFFEPDELISPSNLFPPSIMYCAIIHTFLYVIYYASLKKKVNLWLLCIIKSSTVSVFLLKF